MRHNALVALNNEFLYITGIGGIGKLLFAKAAKTAKLPNLVLPLSDTKLFINACFFFCHPIKLFIKTKPFVGLFVPFPS